MILNEMLKRLTDNYNKSPTSNIAKLFTVVADELERIKSTLLKIEKYRSIDNATGVTLDNIGKNVLQDRGSADDVVYRKHLKTKIKANLSGGEIETLNELLDAFLGDNFLGVREAWNDPSYDFEPATIVIRFQNLNELIEKEYEELENEPWFLDGLFLLDGEKNLDGGLTYSYSDFEEKILIAITETKEIVNFVKAGGIKIYWEEPIEIQNTINIINKVQSTISQLIQNTIEIQHNVSTNINHSVVNSAKWYLDGMYNLDGTVLLNGERPIIAHNVDIQEVIA